MAYNEKLGLRIRRIFENQPGWSEKKMFGGLAFLLHGHMCCGIVKDRLVVRVGPTHYEKALNQPHVRTMDFTGRPIKGFVFVLPKGYQTARSLSNWVAQGIDFAHTLPSKIKKKQSPDSNRKKTGSKL